MKHLAKLLLALLPLSSVAAPPQSWLAPVPHSAGTWREWSEIPSTAFFEVPASKLPTAEAWLSDSAYMLQDQGGVRYFGRVDFKCTAPAKPYLVRATYVSGGTGSFSLAWAGSALVVAHASLGPGGPASKSALLVCLSREPTAVFSSLSGAL